ncbi:MAG: hypothetical protein ACJ736_30270 [Streptomyces sp.]
MHGLEEQILSAVSVGTEAVALHCNEKPMYWSKYAVDGDVIVDFHTRTRRLSRPGRTRHGFKNRTLRSHHTAEQREARATIAAHANHIQALSLWNAELEAENAVLCEALHQGGGTVDSLPMTP